MRIFFFDVSWYLVVDYLIFLFKMFVFNWKKCIILDYLKVLLFNYEIKLNGFEKKFCVINFLGSFKWEKFMLIYLKEENFIVWYLFLEGVWLF